MRVTRIRIYPVKSFEGNDVDTATVQPWGLEGDRRWALIDDTGDSVTARRVPGLLGLRAENLGDGIRLIDRGGASLTVPTPTTGPLTPVGFSRLESATLAHDDAHTWISTRVDYPVRLVWQADPAQRSVSEPHGGLPGDTLSLADAGPLLVATEASLRRLNEWVAADAPLPDPAIDPKDVSGTAASAAPLDIVRFRPNVVIDGDEPFAEDNWSTLRIGGAAFRVTELCDRCVMTTIDPVTLAGGKEPIRTLARHRRWDGKTWFGIRIAPADLDPATPTTISVGDEVVVD